MQPDALSDDTHVSSEQNQVTVSQQELIPTSVTGLTERLRLQREMRQPTSMDLLHSKETMLTVLWLIKTEMQCCCGSLWTPRSNDYII